MSQSLDEGGKATRIQSHINAGWICMNTNKNSKTETTIINQFSSLSRLVEVEKKAK